MTDLACPLCHLPLCSLAEFHWECRHCGAEFPRRASLDVMLTAAEWDMMQASPSVYSALDVESYSRARRASFLTRMYYDFWVDRMLGEISVGHAGVLVELMCGEGEISRRCGERFSTVYAIDLDVRFVANLARDLGVNGERHVRPICANAARLPLPDASVGVVAIMGGLHHARPLIEAILTEICRILKPAGILVVSEPANDHWLVRSIRHWQYSRSKLQGRDPGEDGFSRAELDPLLAKSGFRLESYKVFGFLAYPLMGNTDLVPLLASSASTLLGKALLHIDEALERVPVGRDMGWASLFRAVKRNGQ